MRITGGALGGRKLASPPRGVRPSADRVRESLFARLGELDSGCNVLDLFAGTGALGIESLSRGAGRVVFVERSRVAVAVLRRNLHDLELEARARVLATEARAAVRVLTGARERFQLVFADPPYDDRGWEAPLAALVAAGCLSPGATVVVERSRRHPLAEIPGLRGTDSRRYGDTVIEWLAHEPEAHPARGEPPA